MFPQPQDFVISQVEIYEHSPEDDEACECNLEVQMVMYNKSAVLSQYSNDSSVVDDGESRFVIEDRVEMENSYLTFQPFEFRSTQINSQVILTRSDEESTYFILHLDTPEDASRFADYIRQFSIPQPNGLLIPTVLENFLSD